MEAQEDSQSTALATIEKQNAMEVFTNAGQLQRVLDQVRQLATTEITDATTPAGRAAIKTLTYKVKRTKTAIDGAGKELVDELKDLPKRIDANRKAAREFLDALHDEVRQPLTEYENEQKRIEAEKAAAEAAIAARKPRIQSDIDAITRLPLDLIGKSSAAIRSELETLEAGQPTEEGFDDRHAEATERWQATTKALLQMAEQAEALEAQERDRAERDAADRARRQEQERSEQKILQARMEAERSERERQAAEQRALQMAADNERLQREAAQREEQARAQAAEQERQRIASEQEAQRKADAERAANVAHRKAINNAAVNAMMTHAVKEGAETLTIPQCQAVIIAIFEGKIPNVTINY